MSDLGRHKRFYAVMRQLIKPYISAKFNYHYPDLSHIKPPYLLLVNHNCDLDPLMVTLPFKHHMYFVASENVARPSMGSAIVMRYCRPIMRTKGRAATRTAAEILRAIKNGSSVCIFAEGNRSYNGRTGNILPSTGRIAKKAGVPLVTYRISGGYLSTPRWATNPRKGEVSGKLVGYYSAEEMSAMTDDEVNNIIKRDLLEDAFETQKIKRIPFKGRDLALGLETAFFVCPKCHSIARMKSAGDSVKCLECGHEYTYDVYGDVRDEQGNIYPLTEWDEMQKAYLKELSKEGADTTKLLFSDDVVVNYIDYNHRIVKRHPDYFRAYADRFELGERVLRFNEIVGMSIFSRNKLIIHDGDKETHLELHGEPMFCATKYLYLYQAVKGENF